MRNPIATVIFFLLAFSIFCDGTTNAYNVLMATMGGTKSHTIPFVALGISLKTRGHNVTLLSAFPGPAANNGLQEFVPPIFEAYVGNYTSEWDLVGARFRDEMPISPWDAMRYAWESCEALLRDEISVAWLRRGEADSRKRWDVAVVDGAFPECLLGVLHGEGVPIIMLNTVALYSGSISRQGNPSPWSVTPYFGKSLTQDMSFVQRILNAACLVSLRIMHWFMITGYLQPVLRKYLGFIFVSMGSSVRASGMPEALRQIFVAAFATLPCNVVWKWEGMKIKDLPSNVRTAAWWPQQELLGHPKLRAFVSHGGLLSLHEAAYHAAPTLVLPVFCDHDGNAAQGLRYNLLSFAEKLGYALVMDLAGISIGSLRDGILKVAAIHNNSYRTAAKKRSTLLRDLPINPRKLATWWVEHVAKYKGEHLKSSTRYMSVIHYYSIDVIIFYVITLTLLMYGLKKLCWRTISKQVVKKKMN